MDIEFEEGSRGVHFPTHSDTVAKLIFLVAQIVVKLQSHRSPSGHIYTGGAFIAIGGLIMTLTTG